MLWQNNFPSIVMLHHVSNDDWLGDMGRWRVSTKAFDRLLDYIEKHQYSTVDFRELIKREKPNTSQKQVIITFDDCPKHLFDYAVPQLIKRRMKAVFYMPTDYIGGVNRWDVEEGRPEVELMNEGDIVALAAEGMEIGSHAHRHVELEYETEKDVREDMVRSKVILEDILNKEIVSVAYPYGSVPLNHKAICREVGFRFGVSVVNPVETKYSLRRWIFDDNDTEDSITVKLSSAYKRQRWLNDKRDVWSKRILRRSYKYYSALKKSVRAKGRN